VDQQPSGDYLPFAEVIDLLACGPAKMAIGLSETDEHAAQLGAGIALINAAIEGKIKLIGTDRLTGRKLATVRLLYNLRATIARSTTDC
jgi:hypothetical protein